MNSKSSARQKIKFRIRNKISGVATKPRLSVFRSNAEIYAQLIDDDNAVTIASVSSKDKDILAQKVTDLGVTTVVFDRGGYIYHGRVKAVAEGAREGGLQF